MRAAVRAMIQEHFGPKAIECGHKRKYPSQVWADAMARAIEGAESWDGFPLHSFKCSWCPCWHLAHPVSPENLANRRATLALGLSVSGPES